MLLQKQKMLFIQIDWLYADRLTRADICCSVWCRHITIVLWNAKQNLHAFETYTNEGPIVCVYR